MKRRNLAGAKTLAWLAGWILLALIGTGLNPSALMAAEWIKIKRVNDGDTVRLADGRLVRYIGVDAPEIDHANGTAQPFGFEARTRNVEWVEGKTVRLEFDSERYDHHGRTLAYVFLPDGALVNERLLQSGLAFCLYTLPNVKYEKRLLAAQRDAMRARRGLWQGWNEADGRYLGNRNSRRFHAANCPEGKRISRQNRFTFSKRWDAFWAGYAPARECHADFYFPPAN
jgi:micrococcal nuclease